MLGVPRLQVYDLIARVQGGHEGGKGGLGQTVGYQDLVRRGLDLVHGANLVCKRLPQLGLAL